MDRKKLIGRLGAGLAAVVLLGLLVNGSRVVRSCKVQQQLARGAQAAGQGDYAAAIEAYSEAILLDEEDGALYARRGDAYMETQDYADAALDYRKAIDLGEREQAKLEMAVGEAIREISAEQGMDAALDWLARVKG